MFCGSFTSDGIEVAAAGGRLAILHEGRHRKFLAAVEQITFSGAVSAQRGQEVLYVTERAVFRLTPQGVELTEIASGVDLQDDILAHMAFAPIIAASGPAKMDERIFREEPLDLRRDYQSVAKEVA